MGSFVDKERDQRRKTTSETEELGVILELLRQDVDKFKSEITASIEGLDKKIDQYYNEITLCSGSLASIASQLQDTKKQGKEDVDKLELQMQVVNDWQTNFTTMPLYQDIAKHVTNTLPPGTLKNIAALTSRVDAIEAKLAVNSNASEKKRKTSHR